LAQSRHGTARAGAPAYRLGRLGSAGVPSSRERPWGLLRACLKRPNVFGMLGYLLNTRNSKTSSTIIQTGTRPNALPPLPSRANGLASSSVTPWLPTLDRERSTAEAPPRFGTGPPDAQAA